MADSDQSKVLPPELEEPFGGDPSRRKFLIAATSLMGAAGAGAAAVPFIASWKPNARARAAGAPVRVDLSRLKQGQMVVVEWRGKPVYVVRRGPEQLQRLQENESQLSDASSALADQPEYIHGPGRALKADYLVLIGLCTHLGCAPKYRPEIGAADLGKDWLGGFFCPCHGSRFDLSGRVYRNMPASPNNLAVPPHSFAGDTLLVIGVDPDQQG